MTNSSLQHPESESFTQVEIFSLLKRRYKSILSAMGAGIAFAVAYNYLLPKTWKGDFQIVLLDNKSIERTGLGLASNITGVGALGLLGGANSELKTKVHILRSPLLLKPVYDVLNDEGHLQIGYGEWLKHLGISLAGETSILNVEYKSPNRDSILPTLNKVSAAYQEYSIRDRSASLNEGISYLSKQVIRYKELSKSSSKLASSFALKYGISRGMISPSESASTGAFNVAEIINQSSSPLQMQARTFSPQRKPSDGTATRRLSAIHAELIKKRQVFTDKDPSIIALLREEKALREYNKSSAMGFISPTSKNLSEEEAQTAVHRFEELDKQASRDASTLSSLEDSLMNLKLEKARAGTPWELISSPTIQGEPIYPRKFKNILIGIMCGFLSGVFLSTIQDKTSKKVFSRHRAEESISLPPLACVSKDNLDSLFSLLRTLISQHSVSSRLLIVVLGHQNALYRNLNSTLATFIEQSLCTVSTHLPENCTYSHVLLILESGEFNIQQLELFRAQLDLMNSSDSNWVWIS